MSNSNSKFFDQTTKNYLLLAALFGLVMIGVYYGVTYVIFMDDFFPDWPDRIVAQYDNQQIGVGLSAVALYVAVLAGIAISQKHRHLNRSNLMSATAAMAATTSGLLISTIILFFRWRTELNVDGFLPFVFSTITFFGAICAAMVSARYRQREQEERRRFDAIDKTALLTLAHLALVVAIGCLLCWNYVG